MTCSLKIILALLLSCTVFISSCSCKRRTYSPEVIALRKVKRLAGANNYLSLNLLRQLTANSTENIVFSPLSLSAAFGMLYLGARGDTAEELRAALGYEEAYLFQQSLVHEAFQRYFTEYLPSQDNSSAVYLNRHFVFRLANAVVLDKRLNLIPSYKKDVQDLYQASVKDVDFVTESPEVVDEINRWVEERTNGQIKTLINDLDPSTALLLLNAVYFKATWDAKFDVNRTRPGTFYNYGMKTGAKEVPMMKQRYRFPYTAAYDFRALELPYKGNYVSMMILLPNQRDGLESIEKNLTLEKLWVIGKQLRLSKVQLTIPKFKIEYSKEMSDDFKAIGAKKAFTSDADFTGIASDLNIGLDQVLHKAVFEVNEEGSEGTAATIVGTKRKSDTFYRITVDHPFLFAIIDKSTHMILFLGRITNL